MRPKKIVKKVGRLFNRLSINEGFPFRLLPIELRIQIFSYLAFVERVLCMRVTRQLRHFACTKGLFGREVESLRLLISKGTVLGTRATIGLKGGKWVHVRHQSSHDSEIEWPIVKKGEIVMRKERLDRPDQILVHALNRIRFVKELFIICRDMHPSWQRVAESREGLFPNLPSVSRLELRWTFIGDPNRFLSYFNQMRAWDHCLLIGITNPAISMKQLLEWVLNVGEGPSCKRALFLRHRYESNALLYLRGELRAMPSLSALLEQMEFVKFKLSFQRAEFLLLIRKEFEKFDDKIWEEGKRLKETTSSLCDQHFGYHEHYGLYNSADYCGPFVENISARNGKQIFAGKRLDRSSDNGKQLVLYGISTNRSATVNLAIM